MEDDDSNPTLDVVPLDDIPTQADRHGPYTNASVSESEEITTRPMVYVYACFLVIASVLGTGILGLPVKLAYCGFTPFVVVYTMCFIFQTIILWYMAELLARAYTFRKAIVSGDVDVPEEADPELPDEDDDMDRPSISVEVWRSSHPRGKEGDKIDEEEGIEEGGHEGSAGGGRGYGGVSEDKGDGESSTDLHSLGKLYLGKYNRLIFDFMVMLHFISILISYSLAGTQAYAEMFETVFGAKVPSNVILLPFVGGLALLVVFGKELLQYIITGLTLTKGVLLIMIVMATAYVGSHINRNVNDDWMFMGDSFLVGTVALGGAVNVIPVVFGDVTFNKKDLSIFVSAISIGLMIVFVLNVFWCYYILHIVPQVSDPGEDIPSSGEGVHTLADAHQHGE